MSHASTRFARIATLLILGSFTLATACSDDGESLVSAVGDGGSTTDGGALPEGGLSNCIPLKPSFVSLKASDGLAGTVAARAGVKLEGMSKTEVAFEMYVDEKGKFPSVGDYDLSNPPYSSYGTCPLCTVLVGYDRTGAPKRLFAQVEGTARVIEGNAEQGNDIFAVDLKGIKLVEFNQNPDQTWVRAPGNECYTLDQWLVDTRPVDGATCEKAEDCPNTLRQVCSPKTGKCTAPQCETTGDLLCDEGSVCKSQTEEDRGPGGCYTSCVPGGTPACSADEECVTGDIQKKFGVCKKRGAVSLGASCTEPDISTGCVAGGQCIYDGDGTQARCQPNCTYFAADPGCPAGRACDFRNRCMNPSYGVPVAVGAKCPLDALNGTECGNDGKKFAGLCLQPFPDIADSTCQRVCKVGDPSGCAASERCQVITDNTEIGVCWPRAICGDGTLDIYAEKCDDGNTTAGDGCAADCTAPEYGALCTKALPLPLGATFMGSTTGGVRGYFTQCGAYDIVPARTYSFQATQEGTLEVELLASPNEMLLSAYSDCANPLATELDCSLNEPNAPSKLKIKFDTAASKPTLIVVQGKNISIGGDFMMRATFTPAVCGDGKVAGREQCDDRNTTSGDGCSATCRIEWPILCGNGANALPLLSLTAPNLGTTLGAPDRVSTKAECTTIQGTATGSEALYRFQAPANGTLKLKLAQQTGDQNIFGYAPCGPKTGPVDFCGNSGFNGALEETEYMMTRGQTVVVGVENRTGNDGPFRLDAQFVP